MAIALLPAAAWGEDPPYTAEDVLDAVRKPDKARLREFAARETPDPWIVADELLGIGEKAAAEAFARAVPAERGATLVAHLASPGASAGAAAARAALRAAYEDLDGARPASALRDLAPEEARSPPGTILAARIHETRGQALSALKQRGAAAEAFGRAATEALRLGWRSFAKDALDASIDAYYRTYLYDACRDRLQDRREMQDAVGDAKGVADTDRDLGSVEEGRGDFAKALQRFEAARIAYNTLGLPLKAAMTTAYIGSVRRAMGDFPGAWAAFEEVERVHAAAKPEVDEVAEVQAGRALLYREMGDTDNARKLLERAAEGFRTVGDAHGEAQSLGNLGLVDFDDGRWSDAKRRLEDASVLFERLDEPKDIADALLNLGYVNLGMARQLLGRSDATNPSAVADARRESGDLMETALAKFRAALTEQEEHGLSAGAAISHGAIGEALLAQGRIPDALREFERARDEADRLKLNQVYVELLSWLARAHHATGTPQGFEEAIRYARMVVRESSKLYLGLSEDYRARARTRQADAFDTGAMAAAGLGRVDDLAYFLEAGRAASLLQALGGRASARYATVPVELRDLAERAAKEKAAAHAQVQAERAAGKRDVAASKAAYESKREAERQVVERIRAVEEAAASRLEPPRIESVADLRRRLDPGDALVLYGLFAREAWAVVIDSSGGKMVALHDTKEGTAPLRAALDRFAVTSSDGPKDPSAAAELRTRLVERLQLPADTKRLLVSPDADLSYLPFSLLVPPEWEVVYEPSGTLWRLLLDDARISGRSVLAVGDPLYGREDPSRAPTRPRGADLRRLRATAGEVMAVAPGKDDVRLLREDATEARVRRELTSRGEKSRWHSVHFACHGLVDMEHPTFSSLALGSGDGEDGLLTALEVFRWRIPTDLAVLSACATARGRYLHGEGIVGLTRAFMYAGAPRVLVSLWDVDDLAAQAFMTEFYARWNEGSAPAKALREAQTAVRTGTYKAWKFHAERKGAEGEARAPDWSHPRHWAAWVLWGLAN